MFTVFTGYNTDSIVLYRSQSYSSVVSKSAVVRFPEAGSASTRLAQNTSLHVVEHPLKQVVVTPNERSADLVLAVKLNAVDVGFITPGSELEDIPRIPRPRWTRNLGSPVSAVFDTRTNRAKKVATLPAIPVREPFRHTKAQNGGIVTIH